MKPPDLSAADDILTVAKCIERGLMAVTPGPSVRQLARAYIALREAVQTPPTEKA